MSGIKKPIVVIAPPRPACTFRTGIHKLPHKSVESRIASCGARSDRLCKKRPRTEAFGAAHFDSAFATLTPQPLEDDPDLLL